MLKHPVVVAAIIGALATTFAAALMSPLVVDQVVYPDSAEARPVWLSVRWKAGLRRQQEIDAENEERERQKIC